MKYRGVQDGSHAGVNEEVWLGIGVAPPELVTSGIGPVVKAKRPARRLHICLWVKKSALGRCIIKQWISGT